MWKQEQIIADLRDLGLDRGDAVLLHTSLRAIGPMEAGAETLLTALRGVLGTEGTLLLPTFSSAFFDPAESNNPPLSPEELKKARKAVPAFDIRHSPADRSLVGFFPEFVRQQPDALRSAHPVHSFAAIGANASFLTTEAPFHYPLGSDSPLARLHQLDARVLLIGARHTANASLHLAEVWADVPYIHRSVQVKRTAEQWVLMQGSPQCSAGFGKVEAVLRQARVLRRGYVGNAECQLMSQRQLLSMAIAMLQGDGAALLCEDPGCRACLIARKQTGEQY